LRIGEGLRFLKPERPTTGHHYLERVNIMKRVQSNIVNLAFTILNAQREDSKGRALKTTGVEINQAVVNGASAGVTLRTINGKSKSSPINLDVECLRDLHTAVSEILTTEGQ